MLINKVKNLLAEAQTSSLERRMSCIKELQNMIWDDGTIQDESVNDILTDIAYELDFYEPNEEWRRESPSYYGEERLKQEIQTALQKLEACPHWA